MDAVADTIIVAALAIAVAHWFPWRKLLRRELPKLAAYCIGVATILGAPSLVYWRSGPLSGPETITLFWAAGVAAGATTFLCWLVDAAIEGTHLRIDAEEQRDVRR